MLPLPYRCSNREPISLKTWKNYCIPQYGFQWDTSLWRIWVIRFYYSIYYAFPQVTLNLLSQYHLPHSLPVEHTVRNTVVQNTPRPLSHKADMGFYFIAVWILKAICVPQIIAKHTGTRKKIPRQLFMVPLYRWLITQDLVHLLVIALGRTSNR